MWGSIITDLAYQTNYWFSFPSSNSDVIISLTMWQYWWWFWFTYYITIYYFLFSRLIRHRLLKFSPRISTSQKAHGKWGDFIICFVPITWCVNILSNSNFILRMLEWQTESSLFTVRVRGRQWYWVYKIELKDLLKATNVSKNIGNNYWELFSNSDSNDAAENLNLIQLRKHNEDYLRALQARLSGANERLLPSSSELSLSSNTDLSVSKFNYAPNKRTARLSNFSLTPALNISSAVTNELSWDNQPVTSRDTPDNLYFVLKQKRFAPAVKRADSINSKQIERHLNLVNNELLVLKEQNSQTWKWAAKRLKYKSSDISGAYNRRLLRTKRVLVLPSNVNLTVITNSFDVVHSWYIPGLGIKLDCIPGRSTHHTLFIDHAGFYYGQCAEICGRYHHHMPIRICALPYEHFMIWWYHYGLPYFNAVGGNRKASIRSGIRQYTW